MQPDVSRASYFGFSFGGILTANLTNRYRKLHLPKPRAIFLDDPHDGGLNGFGEPALDHSLAGIPASVKFECHSGADGVISETGKANSSCNAVFPKLEQVPARNKSLVLTHADTHGQPALSSKHGVCAGGPEPDGLVAESGSSTRTTGTSAGRSGTPCAAAPSRAGTADTRSGTPPPTARWDAGATGPPSPR